MENNAETSKPEGRAPTEPEFTPEQVIDAIKARRGKVKHAARMLGCHRDTIYNYCDRHPEVLEALHAARKEFEAEKTRVAEDELLCAIDAGKQWAIRYHLDRIHGPVGGQQLDLQKLTKEEVITLHHILMKAKPDDSQPAAIQPE